MSALTGPRNTIEKMGKFLSVPAAGNVVLYQGALAVMDGGVCKPGYEATDLIALGRVEETVDNRGGAAGAKNVLISAGTFRFANSGGADAIAVGDVGKDAYVVDDQTVAKTDGSGARSAAGKIMDVDAAGVWIRIGP